MATFVAVTLRSFQNVSRINDRKHGASTVSGTVFIVLEESNSEVVRDQLGNHQGEDSIHTSQRIRAWRREGGMAGADVPSYLSERGKWEALG